MKGCLLNIQASATTSDGLPRVIFDLNSFLKVLNKIISNGDYHRITFVGVEYLTMIASLNNNNSARLRRRQQKVDTFKLLFS